MADGNPATSQTELANIANRLSITAVTLAVAALVVTSIQLTLGNLVSSSSRWKTNSAAIDVSSKHRAWRLAPWSMKVKIYYPQLNFELEEIFDAAENSRKNSLKNTLLGRKALSNTQYTWKPVEASHILDDSHITCVYTMGHEKQSDRANYY